MSDPEALQRALAQLEALRSTLGDAAVDAAAAALHPNAAAVAWADPADPDGAHSPATGRRLRQVSVLFADIADSTAMLARVGAEEATELIARAQRAFAEAVQQSGGEVLRFTGDGIKAVFGSHGLREDEAEHAVRAGLQILAAAARQAETFSHQHGIADFGVRVGIHTGPVLLGGGVEAERGAIGHAVHLAARMEQSAPIGRLRISDDTWALVRGLFVAEEQPPLSVKGVAQPLRTWLVDAVAASAEPTVQRGVDGVASPMVGRTRELAALLSLHAQMTTQQQQPVALLLGEAGVGKTRLRRELLLALDLQEGSPGLMQARAHPSSPLQPYGLLRQLLARWLDIRDDLPADAARARLLSGLAPWLGADVSAHGPQAARIGQLIGLDFAEHPAVQSLGASALQAHAFAALRVVLYERARAQPLLVVLDDLHWADDASLAFVQALLLPAQVAPMTPVPLMLLMLARPALLERSVAPALQGAGLSLCLRLEALDAADGQSLVAALLQPLDEPAPALERLLLDRAGGNPFFLEALVRMLIDDGVIDTRSLPWRLHAARLDALRVPPTLVGVLQARLDALPASDLLALQNASIVGPVFWDAALHALDAAALAALPALQQRSLVVGRATSAFASTDEHAFSHQLLHDTTYGTVLKEHKREGHARAARWLAARVSDRASEFLAITAEHYERAGDSAQALEFWDQAHIDAYRRFANQQALQFIDRALAQPALTNARWRAVLLSNRFTVLDRTGQVELAQRACDELAAHAEACDHDAMRAEVATHRMLQADHDGLPQRARELAHAALALAARVPGGLASPFAALAHGELAWLAVQDHRYDEAAAQVEAGVQQARIAAQLPRRQSGYAGYEVQLRTIAIEALIAQERHADALRAADEAQASLGPAAGAYDRYNFAQRRYIALRNLGRIDEAAVCAQELVDLAERASINRLRIPALMARAESAWLLDAPGAPAAMDADVQRATALAESSDNGAGLPLVLELAGRVARTRGELDAARTAWRDAAERHLALGRADMALQLHCELAALDLQQGREGAANVANAANAAKAAVDAALAAADRAAQPQRRALNPSALLACYRVLAALGDERALSLREDLQQRLEEQLRALPEAAHRSALLLQVPHWREAAALLGLAGITAPGEPIA